MAALLNGKHQGSAPYIYKSFEGSNLFAVPITLKYGLALFKGDGAAHFFGSAGLKTCKSEAPRHRTLQHEAS
jgi:hypothetical protein